MTNHRLPFAVEPEVVLDVGTPQNSMRVMGKVRKMFTNKDWLTLVHKCLRGERFAKHTIRIDMNDVIRTRRTPDIGLHLARHMMVKLFSGHWKAYLQSAVKPLSQRLKQMFIGIWHQKCDTVVSATELLHGAQCAFSPPQVLMVGDHKELVFGISFHKHIERNGIALAKHKPYHT